MTNSLFYHQIKMIPPFLIDALREKRNKTEHEQPCLELPLPFPGPMKRLDEEEDEQDRGITILEIL